MSTFAYFLTVLLVGGMFAACAYLADRVIKLEKRMTYCTIRRREAEERAEQLADKLRYLEAF